MDPAAIINRLRALATGHEIEADALYRKARGRSRFASTYQSEATGKRSDAAFLRDLADRLEERSADASFNEKLADLAESLHG